MVNTKDVLLSILVAYVVMDISFSFMLKRKRPLMFQHMMNVAKKEKRNVFLIVGIAILAGVGTYYLVSQM